MTDDLDRHRLGNAMRDGRHRLLAELKHARQAAWLAQAAGALTLAAAVFMVIGIPAIWLLWSAAALGAIAVLRAITR